MTTAKVSVTTPEGQAIELTRAQLRVLDVLSDGWAWLSYHTALGDGGRGSVSASSARHLADAGLVALADGLALLTDAGRAVTDGGLPNPPPIRHEHGTNACYTLDQCRCESCCEAGVAYRRNLTRDLAYGRDRMVDARPVREHVRKLMDGPHRDSKGMGYRRIAEVAGVSGGTVSKLIYGAYGRGTPPSSRVHRDTAEALLAVTWADMADGSTVPAGPTLDRIDEMVAGGFTHAELGRYLTGNPDAPHHQISDTRATVTVATARKVADLHRRWRDGAIAPYGRIHPSHEFDELPTEPREVAADVA